MSDRGKVHANLVCASGLESTSKQRAVAETLPHDEVRNGGLAGGDDGHRRALDGMAPDGCIDAAAASDVAARECKVFAVYASRLQLAHEGGLSGVGLGDDEQTARVLVETMHDAGTGDAGERGGVVQQRVGERSIPVAAARMHDQSGRLVDDEQRGILVHDRKRNGLRHERGRPRIGQRCNHEAFAAIQPPLGVHYCAGERHAAGIDPGADAAA